MSSRVCGSCGLAGGDKYKCAQCKNFKYCSVACYKLHQQTCSKPKTDADKKPPTTSTAASPSPSSADAPPPVPKSSVETVAAADLDNLARSPEILRALESEELRAILRRIDGGDVESGIASTEATGTGNHHPSDSARMAALEKFRQANPEFEQFVQNILQVINKE